jgi:hypothetical protein
MTLPRFRSGMRPTRGSGLLALLVWASVVTSQPPHLHQGETPGVYNPAHVLSALAVLGGDGPLPAPASVAFAALDFGGAPIIVPTAAAASHHGPADPRAPPAR